jgi:hypothetical protein
MTENRTSQRTKQGDAGADHVYTLTLYVAAPGTPIRQQDGSTQPSLPGHVYYSVSDGDRERGFGFSPIAHGTMRGPGRVVRNEHTAYEQPLYGRTMEITAEQYEKLLDYGRAGQRGDDKFFNLQYNGASNSCVDFVWKGLEHAGIHRKPYLPLPGKLGYQDSKGYDGELKPTHNAEEFQRLDAPIPDSPYNKTERSPMPAGRTFKHRLLSDELAPDPAARDVALLDQLREGVRGLDQRAGKQWDANSDRLLASAYELSLSKGFNGSDEVLVGVNNQTSSRAQGELLMVARVGASASPDPFANRNDMPMTQALSLAPEDRFQQAEIARATQQAQQQEQQTMIARGAQDPVRSGPSLS